MNHLCSVQRPFRRYAAAALSLLALSMATGARAEDTCSALAARALPDATITVAEAIAPGQYPMPENPLTRLASFSGMNPAGRPAVGPNPAFCRVAATLRPSSDSDIKIEVWLPLNGWNGKLLGVGSFGWGGAMMYPAMLAGLEQGYATAATDTGHDSSTEEGKGGQFALGHPEKLIDYAWRADHLMTVHAKELIKAYYGKPASRAYWIGCSLGGLEGLIEARRFPDDYDGIVAGAPPNPLVKFNAAQLWPGWLLGRHQDLNMTGAKLEMVSKAALKACASPIGLKQGFIDDPQQCTFEPEQLLCKGAETADCLTAGQVDLMKQLYRGPINPRTQEVIFPGVAKGNERLLGDFVDGKAFPVALDLFKYAAFQDPDWDWTTMDWDKTVNEAVNRLGPLLHVDSNLAAFFDRGAKLLLYVGWNDFHNGQELIDYYQSLLRDSGKAARASARLFLIPGMGHCYGGAGCDTFDKLATIDNWVEHGVAPQRIVASKIEDGKVVRTRPLCAWPQVARYAGKGDIDNADSYACVDVTQ